MVVGEISRVAKSVRVKAGLGGSFLSASRMEALLKMRPEPPNSMKLSASIVATSSELRRMAGSRSCSSRRLMRSVSILIGLRLHVAVK